MSSHSSASPNQIEATLRQLFLQLPNSQTWPLLNEIWHKATEPEQLRMAWRLPLLSCEAVGGELKTAVFGVAAIGCMQLSIIFVDDVLDDDVNGVHQRYGAGVAANLAVALQGTAVTLLQQTPITDSIRWQAAHCLSYPQKQEFQQKMAKNDFEAVRQILVDIGAVHYALHTLQETQTEALSFLSKMTELKKSEPIAQLLKQHNPLIEQLGQLLA